MGRWLRQDRALSRGRSPEQRLWLTDTICSWGVVPSIWFEVFPSYSIKWMAEIEAHVLCPFVKMQLRAVLSLSPRRRTCQVGMRASGLGVEEGPWASLRRAATEPGSCLACPLGNREGRICLVSSLSPPPFPTGTWLRLWRPLPPNQPARSPLACFHRLCAGAPAHRQELRTYC